jgi:hypothetical protein
VTGCGCLLLIAAIVGLIVFMIFGSTDTGEPVETAAAMLVLVLLGQRLAFMPLRRALVPARDA